MAEFEKKEITNVSTSGLGTKDVFINPTITKSAISKKETAKILFEVRWTGDRHQSFSYGSGIPFDCPQRSTESSGLLLLLEELDETKRSAPNWVPSGEEIERFEVKLPRAVSYLDPGQTATGLWEVWADPQSDAERIPTGKHTFVGSLKIGDADPIEWTITVKVVDRD